MLFPERVTGCYIPSPCIMNGWTFFGSMIFFTSDTHFADPRVLRIDRRPFPNMVVGNNDPETTTSASGWTSVQHYRELEVDGLHLILCHYAFRTWNKMGKKSINLHGHSHGRLKPFPRQFDVGVDAQLLRPVTLAQIISKQGQAQALVPS